MRIARLRPLPVLKQKPLQVLRTPIGHGIGDVVRQPFVDDELAAGDAIRQRAIVLDGMYRIAAGRDREHGAADAMQIVDHDELAHHGHERSSTATGVFADSAMNHSTNPGSAVFRSTRSAIVSRRNAARPFSPMRFTQLVWSWSACLIPPVPANAASESTRSG